MKARVVVAPEAAEQIREAYEWWRKYRPAAPALFLDSLDRTIAMLTDAPQVGKLYRRGAKAEIRRVLIPETRYHIYYAHDPEADELTIRALWSAVRGRTPGLR